MIYTVALLALAMQPKPIRAILCTKEMIEADYTQYNCRPGTGEHKTICKAHCLEYQHHPTACMMEPCCEETPYWG